MRIAFLHPDLGLGGAERLIVDAAAALVQKGNHVTLYTSHYEAQRAFAETRDGSFAVRVYGDFLPRHAFGKLHIFFAILRAVWLAVAVALVEPSYDVFICDQVAAYLPVLRLLRPWTPLLFYCHFPDMLLSIKSSWLKRLYRLPFDLFEEVSTSMAHTVVVNSVFTRNMVQRTFRLCFRSRKLQVLYPCIDVPKACPAPPAQSSNADVMFLSINRFERKKAIELAVDAFAELKRQLAPAAFARLHLVLAGGYDTRVTENVEYYAELKLRAVAAGLLTPAQAAAPATSSPFVADPPMAAASTAAFQQVEAYPCITFVRSFSDEQKRRLLAGCACVVYTPSNEHFGIVPIEAGTACRPVIAIASGGPLESVQDGRTGFLCAPDTEAFAAALKKIAVSPGLAASLGQQGYAHVKALFSREEFGARLHAMCSTLTAQA